jgi:hypothetical protein
LDLRIPEWTEEAVWRNSFKASSFEGRELDPWIPDSHLAVLTRGKSGERGKAGEEENWPLERGREFHFVGINTCLEAKISWREGRKR